MLLMFNNNKEKMKLEGRYVVAVIMKKSLK
jgi:hypothetical protein